MKLQKMPLNYSLEWWQVSIKTLFIKKHFRKEENIKSLLLLYKIKKTSDNTEHSEITVLSGHYLSVLVVIVAVPCFEIAEAHFCTFPH